MSSSEDYKYIHIYLLYESTRNPTNKRNNSIEVDNSIKEISIFNKLDDSYKYTQPIMQSVISWMRKLKITELILNWFSSNLLEEIPVNNTFDFINFIRFEGDGEEILSSSVINNLKSSSVVSIFIKNIEICINIQL